VGHPPLGDRGENGASKVGLKGGAICADRRSPSPPGHPARVCYHPATVRPSTIHHAET